jgi:hypothetical protein
VNSGELPLRPQCVVRCILDAGLETRPAVRDLDTEDKVMIEAQQAVIDRTPDPQIMPTTADKGVTLFSQIVRRLIRSEQVQGAQAHPVTSDERVTQLTDY